MSRETFYIYYAHALPQISRINVANYILPTFFTCFRADFTHKCRELQFTADSARKIAEFQFLTAENETFCSRKPVSLAIIEY